MQLDSEQSPLRAKLQSADSTDFHLIASPTSQRRTMGDNHGTPQTACVHQFSDFSDPWHIELPEQVMICCLSSSITGLCQLSRQGFCFLEPKPCGKVRLEMPCIAFKEI